MIRKWMKRIPQFDEHHAYAILFLTVVGGSTAQLSNYTNKLLCASKSSRAPTTCSNKGGSDTAYGLFALGMFIAGAGCAPMISLGVPYMDESVSQYNSPIYLGLFQSSGIICKGLFFSLSLGLYLQRLSAKTQPNITQDPSWNDSTGIDLIDLIWLTSVSDAWKWRGVDENQSLWDLFIMLNRCSSRENVFFYVWASPQMHLALNYLAICTL